MYLPIKIKFVDITIFGRYTIKIDCNKIKFDWHMTKMVDTKLNLIGSD